MTLQELNAKRWADMRISSEMGPAFERVASRLSADVAKERYRKVEKLTGVPWQVIAVIHEREASQKWDTQLGQGDPLNKKSTHVPKGRGPFTSWEDGAVDALTNCAPYASKNTDWSVGGTLALLEKYNGLGYYNKGVPSPYVWAGTNQYSQGKYVADGVYDASAVDKQLGCAGLLRFMGWGKPASNGPIAAGTVATAGAAAAVAAPTNYLPWIIGGTCLAALIAFLVFDIMSYNKWKKDNAINP